MIWKRFRCWLFGHDLYIDHVYMVTDSYLQPLKYEGKYNCCRRCNYKEYIDDE